uniref:Uncharacterized protein n=1 Tax=Aureoumbra lagunensis TaxID=44058 RepID=A0A7S3JRQ7_9STRA|mmetsp:Transcript_20402/g.26459  ORF Transcript_20402/g.26459 Transcript_20402/m.26459 type:complete len:286 (+) Transcript_20402:110-967(+)
MDSLEAEEEVFVGEGVKGYQFCLKEDNELKDETPSAFRVIDNVEEMDGEFGMDARQFIAPLSTSAFFVQKRLQDCEAQLAATVAARDLAEQRAQRAESELVSLRKQMSLFGENLLKAARCQEQSQELSTVRNRSSATTIRRPSSPSEAGSDLISRDSDTRPSKKQRRRIWEFNQAWLQQYPWLEYNEETRTMGCSVCRMAHEKSRWGKTEICRLRIGSVRSHANDQKHMKHVRAMNTVSPSIESGIIPITDEDLAHHMKHDSSTTRFAEEEAELAHSSSFNAVSL